MIYKGLRKRDVVTEKLKTLLFFAILLVRLLILLKQYSNQTFQQSFDRNIRRSVGSAVYNDELKTVVGKPRRDMISWPKGKAFIQI